TTPALVSRSATNEPGRERWIVSSPALGRNVEADVPVGEGGPVVSFLEGIDSPKTSTRSKGRYAHKVLSDTDAAVVMPAHGAGPMWQDWDNDDAALRRHQWDTFLTGELAPVVEEEVSHNGKRGLIGLSMGASGAVMMANNNPGFFDGVAGISGCY